MARSAPAFSSFTAGEISPRLEGRTNIEKYREGLSDLTNMVVMPHGGVTRRPGTEFLGQCASSSNASGNHFVRLIPFQFKTSDTYILEFTNETMRVFRNDLQVLESSGVSISGASYSSGTGRLTITTSSAHNFGSGGQEIFISGVSGMTELNNRNFRVSTSPQPTSTTFVLDEVIGGRVDASGFTAYTSGGTATKIYEKTTPYQNIYLQDLRFAQSADTMYIVHPNFAVRTLTRSDHNNWTFAAVSFTENSTPTLSSSNNYPSVVSFFEQRLVFANTNNNPQTLWFSKNGDYNNFTTGTNADDALIYTIASNQVNAIRFLSATRVLTVGTSGGEYVVTSTNDGPITPTTTLIRKYSNYGSANIEPVQVADVTLFAQRGNRKIREFKFVGDVNTGGYSAPDMTILAEHITDGGITQMAYQQEPDSVVWCVRNDGTLLGLTYRREEEVVAWHKHVIGGTFSSGQAVVESIATLPTDTGEDELYMVVKRTINSAQRKYVEKLKVFDFGSNTVNSFFVDSGLSYSGSSANTLSGLAHLKNESVQILGDGASHPNKTISANALTLDYPVTSAAVGFGFESSMQTLRIDSGSVDGTSQGKPKRIHAITVRFFETVGAEVGNDSGEVDRIFFRDSSMDMDTAVPMFTGDKEIEFPGGFDDDDRIYIKQDQPLPLTVLAFFPRMNTFDK